MPLYFVDTAGDRGTVNDELEVSHDGAVAVTESVESCIELVLDEEQDHDEADDLEAVFHRLFAELPNECPITEVGRTDREPIPVIHQED